MNTSQVAKTLAMLLGELVNGSAKDGGYMLNGGDEGLLKSLEKISAAEASALTVTGSSIAAHTDHLRYGLSLMNRWGTGENPFQGANWGESWQKTTVSEDQWRRLRDDLRAETSAWLDAVGQPREVDEQGLAGMIGSIAHLGYHFGAIRQINASTRGPRDGETGA
jgi:hypothetical protein